MGKVGGRGKRRGDKMIMKVTAAGPEEALGGDKEEGGEGSRGGGVAETEIRGGK